MTRRRLLLLVVGVNALLFWGLGMGGAALHILSPHVPLSSARLVDAPGGGGRDTQGAGTETVAAADVSRPITDEHAIYLPVLLTAQASQSELHQEFGACTSDPTTRISVGFFEVATPFGDCFWQPQACKPGGDAWRSVRTITLENDYIKITVGDSGGGKVYDLQRKVDLQRDRADWESQGLPPPATTVTLAQARSSGGKRQLDPRYPPDRYDRGWLLRGGAWGQGGCDSRPSNSETCKSSDHDSACTPRCEWNNLWGDENFGAQDALKGIESGTPHWVHNTVGTGAQYSVALRDKEESKGQCMFMLNWNPNSNGSCDGTQNGGAYITNAPNCAYTQETCSGPPLGDNLDQDSDLWSGAPLLSAVQGPFRLVDPTAPSSGNEALKHDDGYEQAPSAVEVGNHRVYLRTGMWRSFGGQVNTQAPPDPQASIYITLGKQYWNNLYRRCANGAYNCGDIDASETRFLARKKECSDQGLDFPCREGNLWPKEAGWKRPFPDQGLNREDVWAETYICLQGPEAIFQERIHHPADAARHNDDHLTPAHAIPHAAQRGLFQWAVYGDRGEIRREALPSPDFQGSVRYGDTASDRWMGVLSQAEVYGVFVYNNFNLGVDAEGRSLGKVDERSTSPRHGTKVKTTTFSYKFKMKESVTDFEYRFLFDTPDNVMARARCYNQGLVYPCGQEGTSPVGQDGPELYTWQRDDASGEKWSRVGSTAPGVGWTRLDYVDRLIPIHAPRSAVDGTVDVYGCTYVDDNPVPNSTALQEDHYLAACAWDDADCSQARRQGNPQAPCTAPAEVDAAPMGRLLYRQGLEGRPLWNMDFELDADGIPLQDAFADTFNPNFKPEWENCKGGRCGYRAKKAGPYLGFTPPGPTLAVWSNGSGPDRQYRATTLPAAGETFVKDLGMLLASPPEYCVNRAFDPQKPEPCRPPRVHRLYLCQDGTGASAPTFVSRRMACDDAGAAAPGLSGVLGYVYDEGKPDHHYTDHEQQTVPIVRCHHPVHGWSVETTATACQALGDGWESQGDLGYLAPFYMGDGNVWEPR